MYLIKTIKLKAVRVTENSISGSDRVISELTVMYAIAMTDFEGKSPAELTDFLQKSNF